MSWKKYQERTLTLPELGFTLDYSRMNFPADFLETMHGTMEGAFRSMEGLENGAIANPDEDRMVGHYWLRNPELAPTSEIMESIETTLDDILEFTAKVHAGEVQGANGQFTNLLVIGIGGSALGPQFVAEALGNPATDALKPWFFDNTDPDGIDRTLSMLEGQLGQTLAIVISKSGGTPETRNGMLEAQAAYGAAGLDFARHAVAVTGEGSKLDRFAEENQWLARFPMWDWVGGRTSVTGPVGLLPAALQGIDVEALLEGASQMDEATRENLKERNPAAMLALMWYHATGGNGQKDMVLLPYKDRLQLFSKYLQQLVMESLGKEKDLNGQTVYQGIAVYGNKGSTDQHAYVQQLREGVNNFFVTFIEVLRDRKGDSIEVEPGVTSGDFLQAFLLGTREALSEAGRESITLTVETVSPQTVGMLIALYERAVGFYASLVNINAYHQPGVEAGKKAAATILDYKAKIKAYLEEHSKETFSAPEIAEALNLTEQTELIHKLCEHMAANGHRGLQRAVCPATGED
jgi:glucose-6-phosphate isomerase